MTTPTTPEQAREITKSLGHAWIENSGNTDVDDVSTALESLAAQVEALTAERDTLREEFGRLNKELNEPVSLSAWQKLELERDALKSELDKLKNQEPVAWSVTVGAEYKNCIEITHCEIDAVAQYEASTEGGFESIYTLHKLYAEAGAKPADIEALRADAERSHGLLLWALYNHQGASSPIGQPIRKLLGIGQYDDLTHEQAIEACSAAKAAS